MSTILNKTTLIITFVTLLISGCMQKELPPLDLDKAAIIPYPLQVESGDESFLLTQDVLIIPDTEPAVTRAQERLKSLISDATGFNLNTEKPGFFNSNNTISIELVSTDSSLPAEGYRLNITQNSIALMAADPAGLFYGLQTFQQLLPANDSVAHKFENGYLLPTGTIEDVPNFSHRGAMLDVSRHFFGVADVKQFIDYLAFYKMNRLHLHLADDQGWRIEIKKWPKLTQIGGSTQVGGGKGGFFTQKEYKDIIDYATERHITVIPEIDMPGHTNAALASYPELNCNNKAPKLYTGMRVGFSSLCIHKEITYQFIDDVVGEIAAITPGPYFHIGGDEAHSTNHQDYIYFINRVKDIVEEHGKTMIGWDEISGADIDNGTILQYWAYEKNVYKGLSKGANVIMSPSKYAYMDMKYDSTTQLGLNWAGYIEVDKAYKWHPDTIVKDISREKILGLEAPLWSETVKTMDDIEYLVFPRLPGYAEIGWSQDSVLNWEEYKYRLASHKVWFEKFDINFYKSPKVPW